MLAPRTLLSGVCHHPLLVCYCLPIWHQCKLIIKWTPKIHYSLKSYPVFFITWNSLENIWKSQTITLGCNELKLIQAFVQLASNSSGKTSVSFLSGTKPLIRPELLIWLWGLTPHNITNSKRMFPKSRCSFQLSLPFHAIYFMQWIWQIKEIKYILKVLVWEIGWNELIHLGLMTNKCVSGLDNYGFR